MKKEKLNCIVYFKQTEKTKKCPIDASNILWDRYSDTTLFGFIETPDFKYTNVKVEEEYDYGKFWILVTCKPIITDGRGNDLKGEEYTSHEDFWLVEIRLEIPKGTNVICHNVNLLKNGFQIWATAIEKDKDYTSGIELPHFVEIIESHEDLSCDIDSSDGCLILNDVLERFIEEDNDEE